MNRRRFFALSAIIAAGCSSGITPTRSLYALEDLAFLKRDQDKKPENFVKSLYTTEEMADTCIQLGPPLEITNDIDLASILEDYRAIIDVRATLNGIELGEFIKVRITRKHYGFPDTHPTNEQALDYVQNATDFLAKTAPELNAEWHLLKDNMDIPSDVQGMGFLGFANYELLTIQLLDKNETFDIEIANCMDYPVICGVASEGLTLENWFYFSTANDMAYYIPFYQPVMREVMEKAGEDVLNAETPLTTMKGLVALSVTYGFLMADEFNGSKALTMQEKGNHFPGFFGEDMMVNSIYNMLKTTDIKSGLLKFLDNPLTHHNDVKAEWEKIHGYDLN